MECTRPVTPHDDGVVLLSWDLTATAHRRRAWRTRAWTIWTLTAVPSAVALGWGIHPLLGFACLGTFSIPLRPEALRRFAWARPGSGAVWSRIRADREGIVHDHLFGVGCPPPQRILDPSPSTDRLGLELEGGFQLAWEQIEPLELRGSVLVLGHRTVTLDGVDDASRIEGLRALERLKASAMQDRDPHGPFER